MPTKNTKTVTRRDNVKLGTLDDLLAEADQIAQAEAEGTARALGNWSPGQNLQHLAKFMTCSIDGFGGSMPLGLKIFGRLLRLVLGKKMLRSPPPPGLKLPADVPFGPDAQVSASTGAADLRAVIERVRGGEAFLPASPFLGRLSREQWIELHLRHAELHLSFVGLEG
jgi:hypothetical protein